MVQHHTGNDTTSTDLASLETQPVVTPHSIPAHILRNLHSFDDVAAFLEDGGLSIVSAEVLGDGFTKCDDKARLIGVPLIFLTWSFARDEQEYVTARVVEFDNTGTIVGRWVVVDGGSGIYQQLKAFTESSFTRGGLMAAKGLRVSEYTTTDEEGKAKPAKTFYIDTSATR